MGKMVDIGSKISRSIVDYKLSRYTCYLIVQNADSRKKLRYREDILDNMGSDELIGEELQEHQVFLDSYKGL